MSVQKFIQLFLSTLLLVSDIQSAKILGVFHMPGPSQYLAGSTLMTILAEKGHDVTVIACFKQENPPKNYKQVVLSGVYEKMFGEELSHHFKEKNGFQTELIHKWIGTSSIENAFNHTEFQKVMNSGDRFDVVIVEEFESGAMKYVAHHFKAPLITYVSMNANEWINHYQGNPDSPAYLPAVVLPHLTCKMNFPQRLRNFIQYVFSFIVRNLITIPEQNRILHKYYPNAPHMKDFIYNSSLVLLNSDLSVHEPIPKVPSMVDIGGFHVRTPNPLAEDLQILMDNATNGIIYFSLGTIAKSKNMPKEKLKALLKVFSKLQETILWKYEDDVLPEQSTNVVIRKWFPQNDVLAHKNVKLFITHGGLFSTLEAVFHGVPILVLPVFAEQLLNANRAKNKGYAEFIPFQDVTEDNLKMYVDKLLNNPRYKEMAQKTSQLLNDKPMKPADLLNYWVEYVIRHHGAPHLRVAALDLSWYQYILLDVIIFISFLLILLIFVMKFLLTFIIQKPWKRKQKVE